MGTDAVRSYWQAHPCAAKLAASEPGSAGFYAEVERAKLESEPHEPSFADFAAWSGRDVLEIGCGVGIDTARFARAGARVTAIDLTEQAVSLTRALLELEELPGTVMVADSESLPFAADSFDLVYSWGVIHHAENPARVLREARRVLAANGEVRAMLYGRHSWVAYGLWLRHALLAGHPSRSLADVVASHMESPGTRAYTRGELETLFAGAGFDQVRVSGFATRYDQRAVGRLARIVRRDWFLGVVAT